ncbi:MAG TPA: TonB C-terminal domain-containing protein [Kofleriaceae bacterium]|nr:TonB C-terminal domain-containing protein [Kofleriaceae bacterium]
MILDRTWSCRVGRARRLAMLAMLAAVGCAAPSPHGAHGALVASSARLPPPVPADPSARGASYLGQLAALLQPPWGDFLEDCRLRLPADHPLNAPGLAATFELAIDRGGKIVERKQIETSGNGDFDTAVSDVLADASPLPAPPEALLSDDERAHVRWQFARDRRQAGPATARVVFVELPLLGVIEGLLARGQLERAARRTSSAAATDPDRGAAAERVMIAALREAMASPDGAARRAAIEACGRARVHELSPSVRAELVATADPELRLAAITAVGALVDRAAAPALVFALTEELAQQARSAIARVSALVAIGHAQDAAAAVRAVLDRGPSPIALAALGLVPLPELEHRLAGWAGAGDPTTRAAVCAALPAASPRRAGALIVRGLRDADATVRATCTDAAARTDRARPDAAIVRRLRELVRDRDRSVRARAIAAIGALDPSHPVRAVDDPVTEVRAAFAASATEAELRMLIVDRAPEVRVAALAALGDRAADVVIHAAVDPSPAVRRAAIPLLADVDALDRLARDDSPDVATAALVRLTELRGRAALTSQLLERLVAAPAGSAERARIALAWLLAS